MRGKNKTAQIKIIPQGLDTYFRIYDASSVRDTWGK
jgi:hypothetical protein